MNIFFLSYSPILAAQMHGDLHLIKMILETTQILSTCYRWLNGERPHLTHTHPWITKCFNECGKHPYKMTHYNHGSVIWARQSPANFIWLAHLGIELCKEKQYRLPNKKQHSCYNLLEWFLLNPPSHNLFPINNIDYITVPYIAISDFWNCKLYHIDPYQAVLLSYHKYYRAKHILNIVYYKWAPSRQPSWLYTIKPPSLSTILSIKQHIEKDRSTKRNK